MSQPMSPILMQSLARSCPWASKYLQAAADGRDPEFVFLAFDDQMAIRYLKTFDQLVEPLRQRLLAQSSCAPLSISRTRMLRDSRSDCGAATTPLRELLVLASSQASAPE